MPEWKTLNTVLRRHTCRIGCAGIMLTVLLLSAETVWGRAGGGGSFGGGGGGGGGSFGGGGGGGEDMPPELLALVMIPGILLAIFLGAYGAHERRVARTIRRGRQLQESNAKHRCLAAIRTRDQRFSEAAFRQRVEQAFLKIQTAWCRQDLSDVRAFISDGIHERFSLQVGMQQTEGIRDEMRDVKVLSASLSSVFCDNSFDTIHVLIEASAVDYTVDLDSGRRLRGSPYAQKFVEFWSFHRRPGATSLDGDGTIEGNCPKCGAELEIVDVARCQSCGAQVNSGEFDWVLAEITQDEEWALPVLSSAIPGLTALKRRDPAFSVQHIEDRVSVAFWRMRAAEFYRDLDYARPVLSADYVDTFAHYLGQLKQRQAFWKDPAVGQVEMIDVQNGDPESPDRIRVMIRWSGTYSAGDPGGRSRALREKAIYTQVFLLSRNHNVVSTPAESFRSAGCSSCGAPLRVNRKGACEFCATLITDGRHDWVLESIQPYTPELAFRRSSRLSSEAQAAGDVPGLSENGDMQLSLAVLARVMHLDGHLADNERRALEQLGAHRGLGSEEVQLIIDTARTSESKIPIPRSAQEATVHLSQLVHAVLADGRISLRERKVLKQYAKRSNLSAADVRRMISHERQRAYRQARTALRRSRQASESQST